MPNATSYIAHRLYFASANHKTVRPAVKVALIGLTIGVMVMVITVCVVIGFKSTVASQVAGFGSHIQVVNYDNNNTYEMLPVAVNDSLIAKLTSLPHIRAVAPFYTKPAILRSASSYTGVVLKGTTYWPYFEGNLIQGTIPEKPNEVIVSQSLANKMELDLQGSFVAYFIGSSIQLRKFVVSGIYATGVGEYDNLFILSLPETVQRLNRWNGNQASGIDIWIDDLDNLYTASDDVYFATANRLDADGNALFTQNIQQLNPQIFAWLDLLDMNVVVIIILMLAVAGFAIITGLIILILNSIQLIGTLKALGASNRFVKTVFIKQAAYIISQGMLIGNALGLGLCALQYFTRLFPLDSASYYVNFVPVAFPWGWIIVLNLSFLLLSIVILLLPATVVSRISPAQVMKYE